MSDTSKTPEDIAEDVLVAHAIQPHWARSRNQIKALIIEGIQAALREDVTP